MKTPSTLTAEEADRILEAQTPYRYDQEWNVAICTHCKYAVGRNTLADHARSHDIYFKDYKSCVQALQTKEVRKTLADFLRPSNGIPPIAGLKIDDGFSCTRCNFLTKNKGLIKEHGKKHPGIRDYRREVKLQVLNFCSVLICRRGVRI
jgi:Orsellinic acid/F9775 biosynthesis cluster protein D